MAPNGWIDSCAQHTRVWGREGGGEYGGIRRGETSVLFFFERKKHYYTTNITHSEHIQCRVREYKFPHYYGIEFIFVLKVTHRPTRPENNASTKIDHKKIQRQRKWTQQSTLTVDRVVFSISDSAKFDQRIICRLHLIQFQTDVSVQHGH